MKKFLSFILSFVVLFALTSCFGDIKEEELKKNQEEFNTYLETYKTPTVADIDAMVTSDEMPELPTDFFSNIALKNLSATGTIKSAGVSQNISLYVWQNEGKLFVSPQDEVVGYIDLVELEAAYDQSRQETDFSSVKPSEMIDATLAQSEVPFTLEELLKIISFESKDFTIVEKGKFCLKNDVILAKLNAFFGEEISKEDFDEVFEYINVFVYFDGTKINGYEFDSKAVEDGESQIINFKITLGYAEEVINSINVSFKMDESQSLELSMSVIDEVFAVKVSLNAEGQKMNVDLSLSDSTLKAKVIMNEITLADINLTFSDTKVENKHTFAISGSIMIIDPTSGDSTSLNIKSGNDVAIPSELKALESSAQNLLQGNDLPTLDPAL